jgi:hypothetical protein
MRFSRTFSCSSGTSSVTSGASSCGSSRIETKVAETETLDTGPFALAAAPPWIPLRVLPVLHESFVGRVGGAGRPAPVDEGEDGGAGPKQGEREEQELA